MKKTAIKVGIVSQTTYITAKWYNMNNEHWTITPGPGLSLTFPNRTEFVSVGLLDFSELDPYPKNLFFDPDCYSWYSIEFSELEEGLWIRQLFLLGPDANHGISFLFFLFLYAYLKLIIKSPVFFSEVYVCLFCNFTLSVPSVHLCSSKR